jgi:threonine/homoserine/homoserine lactone efflux protein
VVAVVRWAAVVGFAVAVLPICLTPGTSFTLVTGRVLAKGRRSGVLVAAGTACGILCHATLAGIGLAALVMRSSEAFLVVKLVGAGYLVVLGLTTLVKARRATKTAKAPKATKAAKATEGPEAREAREAREVEPVGGGRRLPWVGRSDFVQGLVGNVLNPKAAAVYLTLAPQFVGAGAGVLGQMLVLAGAHVVVAVGWLLCWTVLVGAARGVVRSRWFRSAVGYVTGVVLVALGVRTAVTS